MARERKYSNTDMLEELQRVADKLGRSPSWNEFDENSEMWAQIISDRFGGWNEAKKEANLLTYTKAGEKSKPENSKAALYRKNKNTSCKFCDEDFKDCLVFHHKEDEDKNFDVSKYARYSYEQLQNELEKCIVVCSNCHRKIHSPNHDLTL